MVFKKNKKNNVNDVGMSKSRGINGRKANMAINTIFYIMMSLFMAGILVFGFNKMFLVQDVLSEQERIEVKADIVSALEYCADPLNSGNIKNIEVKHNLFNSMCVVSKGSDLRGFIDDEDLIAELSILRSSLNDNEYKLVLMKTSFVNGGLQSFNIVDDSDFEFSKDECFFDYENSGVINLQVSCD